VQPRNAWDIGTPGGVSVEEGGSPLVARTELKGSAPNPFNPFTHIRFAVRGRGPVDLAIYDLAGRRVRTLVSGEQLAGGEYSLPWDGRSDAGRIQASGTYLIRFEAEGVENTQKITWSCTPTRARTKGGQGAEPGFSSPSSALTVGPRAGCATT
jgi:hypothetical protein